VKENVPAEQAVTRMEHPLPLRVQEALGELVGIAQEGLMALSVGVGLGVLAELMEEEVSEVVGPRGRHDPERAALRHGHQAGEVTLGGRRVGVERPRVRASDGSGEVALSVYRHFADRDPLSRIVLERMLAGVSCRRYGRVGEPVGERVEEQARGVSKSAISRSFIERTRQALGELMARRLDDVRLAVLMLDGIELKGRTNVVALGITTDGVKIPLGLWEGSSENATVATALLSDLVERGLDTTQGVLCVLDGSKALRKAVREVLGERCPVQRCIRHKERNVTEHLPERDRAGVRRRLRAAWDEADHGRALDRLEQLAAELERSHPGAAASLREGMAETLTLTRLGITGSLRRTLASTNPIESMIECVRRTSRNVKRWQSGEMALRWTAAGMLEAERQFRRIIGYQQLAKLAVAIERELAGSVMTEEVATLVNA
jgi:transposase-like protein